MTEILNVIGAGTSSSMIQTGVKPSVTKNLYSSAEQLAKLGLADFVSLCQPLGRNAFGPFDYPLRLLRMMRG